MVSVLPTTSLRKTGRYFSTLGQPSAPVLPARQLPLPWQLVARRAIGRRGEGCLGRRGRGLALFLGFCGRHLGRGIGDGFQASKITLRGERDATRARARYQVQRRVPHRPGRNRAGPRFLLLLFSRSFEPARKPTHDVETESALHPKLHRPFRSSNTGTPPPQAQWVSPRRPENSVR